MTETIFTNGRIVTADAEFDGTVVVRGGRIVDIQRGRCQVRHSVPPRHRGETLKHRSRHL